MVLLVLLWVLSKAQSLSPRLWVPPHSPSKPIAVQDKGSGYRSVEGVWLTWSGRGFLGPLLPVGS